MPILFRFSQWKQQDFKAKLARTPQELEQVLGPIADAGVDVFDGERPLFRSMRSSMGSLLNLAGWAKKAHRQASHDRRRRRPQQRHVRLQTGMGRADASGQHSAL